jgi:hypothetical protein
LDITGWGPDQWAKDVIERNVEFLREYFLDRILVQRGLLDRRKVEAVVSPRIEKSTTMVSDVFTKLYILKRGSANGRG